jgi:hypothetical protein
VFGGDGLLALGRGAIAAFQDIMIRGKANTELNAWLDRAKGGLLAAFASGMTKDKASGLSGRGDASSWALARSVRF